MITSILAVIGAIFSALFLVLVGAAGVMMLLRVIARRDKNEAYEIIDDLAHKP